MSEIPTIKICNPDEPGGFLTINQADFRPGIDTLWGEDPLPDFLPEPVPDQSLQDKPRRGRRPRNQEA